MFGFLKNILRKPRETAVESQETSGQDAYGSSLSEYMPAAAPAAGRAKPSRAPAAQFTSKGVEISLRNIIENLPLELQPRVRQRNVGDLMISIPLEKVLAQLSRGSVRISFGELRHSAPGVFSPEDDRDKVMVALPLSEIIPRLNPALIQRRRIQKQIEVPPDINSPFDSYGQGLVFSVGPAKPEPTHGSAPLHPSRKGSDTEHRATPGRLSYSVKPAAPVPPPALPGVASARGSIDPIPAPVPPEAAPPLDGLPPAPAPVQDPEPEMPPAPIAFKLPKPSSPPQPPRSDGPVSGHTSLIPKKPGTSHIHKNGTHPPITPQPPLAPAPAQAQAQAPAQAAAPAPIPMPTPIPMVSQAPIPVQPPVPQQRRAAAPAPTPAAPAPVAPAPAVPVPAASAGEKAAPTAPAPAPKPTVPPIVVELSALAENWPDPIRKEIITCKLVDAKVGLPFEALEHALKSGRIVFPWKSLRGWTRPSSGLLASPHDGVALELPLHLVAPLFLERQRTGAKKQQKVDVDEDIPNLFFGFPQPSAPVGAGATSEDTNFYVWDDSSDTAMVDRSAEKKPATAPGTQLVAKYATPNEVVSRAANLDGVAGAVIALPDGLMVASRLAPDMNGETLAAFLPHIFGKVSQCTKELRMGELNNLNFTVGNVPWKIHRVNAIFFAAFGQAGKALPTAQLAALAGELNHKPR